MTDVTTKKITIDTLSDACSAQLKQDKPFLQCSADVDALDQSLIKPCKGNTACEVQKRDDIPRENLPEKLQLVIDGKAQEAYGVAPKAAPATTSAVAEGGDPTATEKNPLAADEQPQEEKPKENPQGAAKDQGDNEGDQSGGSGWIAPLNVTFSYSLALNDGLGAEKHPGLDGSVTPYLDEPVSDSGPGHRFTLGWFPAQILRTDNLRLVAGGEAFYGFAKNSSPEILEERGHENKPGALHHWGLAFGPSIEYFGGSGFDAGLRLLLGWKKYWAERVDLGARGSNRDFRIRTSFFAPEAYVGFSGARVGFRPEILFHHRKERDGMTDADNAIYYHGIGSYERAVSASYLLFFEIAPESLFLER